MKSIHADCGFDCAWDPGWRYTGDADPTAPPEAACGAADDAVAIRTGSWGDSGGVLALCSPDSEAGSWPSIQQFGTAYFYNNSFLTKLRY